MFIFSFWPGEILIPDQPDCDREFEDTSADGLIPMFLFLLLFSLISHYIYSLLALLSFLRNYSYVCYYYIVPLCLFLALRVYCCNVIAVVALSIHPSITTLSTFMYISTIQKEGERETVTHSCVWMGLRTLSMKLGRTTHMLWNESPGNSLHCLMKSPHLMANNRGFSELHQEI